MSAETRVESSTPQPKEQVDPVSKGIKQLAEGIATRIDTFSPGATEISLRIGPDYLTFSGEENKRLIVLKVGDANATVSEPTSNATYAERTKEGTEKHEGGEGLRRIQGMTEVFFPKATAEQSQEAKISAKGEAKPAYLAPSSPRRRVSKSRKPYRTT